MIACMLAGRWGKDLRGFDFIWGAERASLVLRYGTSVKRSLLSGFDAS